MNNFDQKLLIYFLLITCIALSMALFYRRHDDERMGYLLQCAKENHYAADNMHSSIHQAKIIVGDIDQEITFTDSDDFDQMYDAINTIQTFNNDLQNILDNDYYFSECL